MAGFPNFKQNTAFEKYLKILIFQKFLKIQGTPSSKNWHTCVPWYAGMVERHNAQYKGYFLALLFLCSKCTRDVSSGISVVLYRKSLRASSQSIQQSYALCHRDDR
jgi:hypothetical protein